ncbi:HDOD domain-containing protein [Parasulfuritortus cantonensis]|uniref:HDOD domain-containing protein n=1 Tax=Parasulfuritortus cantonensis TaxID=2528202 RepID=A0A4R1B6H4_9PROT|nr:HDOD domain-containing protein [Parasulfuritortus cantonensis]TCJ12287.1 HDOD domain-containing protein [Parasulfuritortus cantonensis]
MSDGNRRGDDDDEVASARQLLADLSKARDFPALSQVISKVNHIASSETSRTDDLTESILKDVALTNKLLRVVNSVNYKQRGAGAVSTVSRAIVILGYDVVRDTALSLMLFDHLANHAQADELKAEAVESFYCGLLGRALAARSGLRDNEEVLICSLFRNLGRMMCRLHFYDKSKEVEALIAEQGLSEAAASRRVFGIAYDDFGQAIGRHWHLPNNLLQGMAPLPPGSARAVGAEVPRLQVMANLAHDVYQATRDTAPEETRSAYAELMKRYGEVVHLQTDEIDELVHQAGAVMEKDAALLQVDIRSSPMLARLLSQTEPAADAAGEPAAPAEETAAQADEPGEAEAADPTTILITGMQDLTNLLLEDARPADVLHVAAELLYRSKCFDNVLISTIAASGKELVGRIGLGPNAERQKAAFRIPLAFAPDVFHVAVSKNADLLIADTLADSIRGRIPAWYTEKIGARSFLLLPITVNNRTVAVLYADKRDASLQLTPQTLGLVKALRNQITLALRQKSIQ